MRKCFIDIALTSGQHIILFYFSFLPSNDKEMEIPIILWELFIPISLQLPCFYVPAIFHFVKMDIKRIIWHQGSREEGARWCIKLLCFLHLLLWLGSLFLIVTVTGIFRKDRNYDQSASSQDICWLYGQ